MPPTQLPQTLPLIVFAGGHQITRAGALVAAKVDAAMVSFEYIRSAKGAYTNFHSTVGALYQEAGTRLYLDSGLFTLMRRVGRQESSCLACTADFSRLHSNDAQASSIISKFGLRVAMLPDEEHAADCPKVKAYRALARDYAEYLSKHHDLWSHVVELDADRILGTRYTKATRKVLTSIVGNKLLPVWHLAAGRESWTEIIGSYPYVCIGAGGWGMGTLNHSRRQLYRSLVREAHDQGTLVHGLGSTRVDSFTTIGWDTADSTTWLSVARFGKLRGAVSYSAMGTPRWSPGASGRPLAHNVIEQYLTEHGLDPTLVAAQKLNKEKLLAAIYLILDRQHELQGVPA